VELCHQGRYRLDAAEATLTRTDWEIAFQELTLAVRVVRAFYAVIYRQEKVCLVEETIRLNQRVLEQIRRLVEQGRLRGADLIVAQTDVDAIRALLSTARSALTLAQAELYRSLGVTCATVNVAGALELPPCATDCQALVEKALHGRADLRGRQVAVDEADARLRLQLADRYGNPTVGPFFEQDPTNISFVGVQMNIPLPLFNTKCGEIQQREAEKQRAFLDVQRTEVLIQQDVEAAVARLASACAGVQVYRAVDNVQKLLQRGEPGVDALKVADLERKLLRTRDGYLDALFEMSQAHADLVAAVGDPLLAVVPCPTPPSLPATHLP
jgi:outer membrane protein TolC